MKTKTLAQQFCQSDLLFRLLNERLQLEPARVALGTAILTCIALWTELALAGIPFSQSGFVVSFQAFIIFPLAIILYFAAPEFLAKPFTVLEKTGSVGESLDPGGESYQGFREKMISSINSLGWIGLAILLIAYYWYYRLFTNVPSDPSRLLPPEIRVWVRIVLLLIYSPLLYMGVLTLGRLLVGLLFMGRFFQSFKIQVNPMSPDGAGGIGFVGGMLINSALIASAFGVGATGLVYVNIAAGNNPLGRVEIIILGLIYLILTPLLFHSLMWSPHRALLRAREDALKPLADEYQRASMQEIRSGKRNVDAIRSKTDQLVEIKRQYELIRDSFPIWTLDVGSLRSLLATSILPAVSTLFSGYISSLWKAISEILKIGKP
jgi:hypothetical protein